MKYFKKPNIFTPLIIVAAIGFSFRLVNIATFKNVPSEKVGAVMSASAASDPKQVKDEPPPLTKEDLAKAVKDTAKAADSGVEEKAGEAVKADEKKTDSAEGGKPPSTDAIVQSPSFSSSEVEVLQSLAKRRDEIDQREKSVAEHEALLKAAEQEVDRKIAELNKLKGDMENLLGQQQKAQEARIASLVKIYENMKPKDAARIFDTLEMNTLLDVIGRMSERKVSPVLASMNPEKAKDVTIKLAEQRKLPAGKEAEAQKAGAAK